MPVMTAFDAWRSLTNKFETLKTVTSSLQSHFN